MDVGGVVLCGGQSRRMGRSKATLPFGDEVMLLRVLRLLKTAVGPLAVVASPDQELPELPAGIPLVRDRVPGRGPLEGLFCGLNQLRPQVAAAYVTGCDVPLLQPALVRHLIAQLEDHDVVVPVEDTFHHPLAAVYRTRLVDQIAALLKRDRSRPRELFDQVATRRVSVEDLRTVDPPLHSLMNLNRPEDYLEALRLAGLA